MKELAIVIAPALIIAAAQIAAAVIAAKATKNAALSAGAPDEASAEAEKTDIHPKSCEASVAAARSSPAQSERRRSILTFAQFTYGIACIAGAQQLFGDALTTGAVAAISTGAVFLHVGLSSTMADMAESIKSIWQTDKSIALSEAAIARRGRRARGLKESIRMPRGEE